MGITNIAKFPARGLCLQQMHKAHFRIRFGETYVGKQLFCIGYRIDIEEIEKHPSEHLVIPPGSDSCIEFAENLPKLMGQNDTLLRHLDRRSLPKTQPPYTKLL